MLAPWFPWTCFLDMQQSSIAKHVTQPWYQKHKEFLEALGFAIQLVQGEIYVKNWFCQCDKKGCHRKIVLLDGGLLFKNLHSPKIDIVNKVFVEKAHDEVSLNDFLGCIAFPIPREWTVTEVEHGRQLKYFFSQKPGILFGDDTLCCAPSFIVLGSFGGTAARDIGRHFWKCYQSMKKIGFEIEFRLEIDENDKDLWSDEDFAVACLESAGEDFDRLLGWLTEATADFRIQVHMVEIDRYSASMSILSGWACGTEGSSALKEDELSHVNLFQSKVPG